MDLYKKTKKFVKESFGKDRIKHFNRTVFWIKKLQPKADETMLIAAVSHDIERAFRKNEIENIKKRKTGFLGKELMESHQRKGGKIIFDFLIKEGADNVMAKKVRELVEKHEVGGNRQQNMLKDADSISFFENNVQHFIREKVREFGKEKIKEKFDWMFDRITSKKAKSISRKWYDEAIKKLGY